MGPYHPHNEIGIKIDIFLIELEDFFHKYIDGCGNIRTRCFLEKLLMKSNVPLYKPLFHASKQLFLAMEVLIDSCLCDAEMLCDGGKTGSCEVVFSPYQKCGIQNSFFSILLALPGKTIPG
jgi:hypothetical protein